VRARITIVAMNVSFALACGLCLFTVGCTSLPNTIPQTVGAVGEAEIVNGLKVAILPQDTHIVLGDNVIFDVKISNTSDTALWVPRQPFIIMVWTYPNGQRDNVLRDPPSPNHFNNTSAILLAPGESVVVRKTIKTHYFPFAGITEFHAICCAIPNTNPELHNFWKGEAVSNGYGVQVQKQRTNLIRNQTAIRMSQYSKLPADS